MQMILRRCNSDSNHALDGCNKDLAIAKPSKQSRGPGAQPAQRRRSDQPAPHSQALGYGVYAAGRFQQLLDIRAVVVNMEVCEVYTGGG